MMLRSAARRAAASRAAAARTRPVAAASRAASSSRGETPSAASSRGGTTSAAPSRGGTPSAAPSCGGTTPGASSAAFWADAPSWRRAARNTTRCLVGCSVGDLSCLWLLASAAPELGAAPAMAASMACGVATSMALETWVLKVWEGFANWTTAASTAANMSLISMLSMEGAENAVSYYATGGDICSEHFFAFLPASLAAGFLTPLPYNYFMLRKHGRACH